MSISEIFIKFRIIVFMIIAPLQILFFALAIILFLIVLFLQMAVLQIAVLFLPTKKKSATIYKKRKFNKDCYYYSENTIPYCAVNPTLLDCTECKDYLFYFFEDD